MMALMATAPADSDGVTPLWEMAGVEPDGGDTQAQPPPDYAFDQRIAW